MIPTFYDEKKIGTIYMPRMAEIQAEAEKAGLRSFAEDKMKVALLIIDMQISFCHDLKVPDQLFVDGAQMDISNTIQFLFKNIEKITTVCASLDTHILYQIFYPMWWINEKGEHPAPYTIITVKDLETRVWKPIINPIWSIDYVKKLESEANKPLCIWPYHTMLGTIGNSLDPALYEVIFFHAVARKSQLKFEQKGIVPSSEMYGVFRPEVIVPNHSAGGFNTDFLNLLAKHDMVVGVGEAKSHCFLESVRQFTEFFQDQPDVLKKFHILEDCMSCVKHPTIDFESITNTEFEKFKQAGINITNSKDLVL